LAWTPELSLHHAELDRQHAALFTLLEAAGTALETGGAPVVVGALAAFTDAMMQHAAAEEALMEETLFADRGRHRVAHEVFLADVEQLRIELAAHGPTPHVEAGLRVRLPEWLRFHIAVNDVPFGLHLACLRGPSSRRRRGDSRRTS
jgi:hemerythrin